MTFQERVAEWLIKCFGNTKAQETPERALRFLEEAFELVQAVGIEPSEAYELLLYVYSRDIGAAYQEVGGVMTTFSALCTSLKIDMQEAAEVELTRIEPLTEKIRAKQAAKPQTLRKN